MARRNSRMGSSLEEMRVASGTSTGLGQDMEALERSSSDHEGIAMNRTSVSTRLEQRKNNKRAGSKTAALKEKTSGLYEAFEKGGNAGPRIIFLKVDKHNRFMLAYRNKESLRWRDVREPRSLWGNLNERQFRRALMQHIADLRRAGYVVLPQGLSLEPIGHSTEERRAWMRKRLVEDLYSAARELRREGNPGATSNRERASKRLERFAVDIERAADGLIGRILAGSHDEKFEEIWTLYRSAVPAGVLQDGADLLQAVASACTPHF
jgi:hypothetical protein